LPRQRPEVSYFQWTELSGEAAPVKHIPAASPILRHILAMSPRIALTDPLGMLDHHRIPRLSLEPKEAEESLLADSDEGGQ